MKKLIFSLLAVSLLIQSCSDDDNDTTSQNLTIPDEFVSPNFDSNVVAENTVINELAAMTTDVNNAEANAQASTVAPISYPATLQSVTLNSYKNLVESWLVELVKSANSPDGFQNPGFGNTPDENQEGGLLGTRLLDEYGLELEQMVEKGSFGAALYNHAVTVVNGIKNGTDGFIDSGAIDRLVEIHGADITFNPSETTAAATYSRRRSNLTAETGFFFDIKTNLITAKAAMEAGEAFNDQRNQALDAFLMNWEKSNFATVIYYCNATKVQLTNAFALPDGDEKNNALGNALHAYAEGVGFTHGFKGLNNKLITDAQIDSILDLLLAPEGQNPESYRFLNEVSILSNLDVIIEDLKDIYGFTNEEVTSFYVNNNP
ncbi:hypothetical protein [Jejuia pallidilutea]|uniref:Uncharacterized protein n=1 Tax=Jejuia pallidilutea TaxID=504487 RepID=A0A090W398_9FLAO|nr:hypothetical protein [Jejuia pallidilutea]GAL66674.1 hypothetical protein JCM19301_3152 [Jejuia pallidilutea]GAL69934.1 hypothetical protein JCM19302_829 [Jejuia pallidilutea]GAL90946.1 hypothetical protein JCM19538_1004 [Jejuia pallidilutea]